jgi:DNA-binding transcriptional MerR regulator
MGTEINSGLKQELMRIIKDRAHRDFYIDSDEEREILQFALQKGMTLEQGNEILHKVCQDESYLVESCVLEETAAQLKSFFDVEMCITEKNFQKVLADLESKTGRFVPGKDWRQQIVSMIEENGYPTKPGWFKDWFLVVKKDLGLA